MAKTQRDLTVGSPWKAIILFALPLLGSSLIQQMYSTVDLIFVSKYLGTEAASAVGSSDLLVTCLVGLFTGISVGTNVAAAQAYGARNRQQLYELIQTAVTFGLIGSGILLIVGELFAPVFLRLIHTPESIQNLALTYLRIYFLCIFSIVLYNLCSGIVRALGDSAAAMRFQLIGGIANIAADFLCIMVFKWGVAGAAIATFLSQTTAACLTIRYLLRLEPDIRLNFRRLLIRKNLLKKVLGVGIPSGIQSMMITFSNIMIQSVINGFGVIVMASFVVYFKLELFIWYPLVAIGQALVTYTAQNIGAGRKDRIKYGLSAALILGIGIALVVGFGILVLGRPIFSIFNSDADVIASGMEIVCITFPVYFIYTFADAFGSVLKGYGKGLPPMLVTIGCMCVFRIIILFVLTSLWHEVRIVAMVYPLSWAFAGLCMALCCLPLTRKSK